MRKTKKILILLLTLFFVMEFAVAQQQSYFDPAVAYNKLLIDKGGKSTVDRIDNFVVNGTPLLYGELTGDIYKGGAIAYRGKFNYNTYSQLVGIKTAANFMVYDNSEIDSFVVLKSNNPDIPADLKFVSPGIYKAELKSFLVKLAGGSKYILYKEYYSSLGIVSTNYIQSELREYVLNTEYYIADLQKGEIKKLKLNKGWLKNKFAKNLPAAQSFIEENSITGNPEIFLMGLLFKLQ